jgi:hypothetical protein
MTNMTGSKLSIFSHPGKMTGYWITTRSFPYRGPYWPRPIWVCTGRCQSNSDRSSLTTVRNTALLLSMNYLLHDVSLNKPKKKSIFVASVDIDFFCLYMQINSSIICVCFYLYVSVVNLIDYSDIDKMMDINNEKC